jgi:hypothetical protein
MAVLLIKRFVARLKPPSAIDTLERNVRKKAGYIIMVLDIMLRGWGDGLQRIQLVWWTV